MKKLLLILMLAFTTSGFAQKILISVDMEGVAGVVTGAQLGPSGFEYQRFREFMTGEAIAAIEGAFEAGAKEIIVADAHGNGQNLLIEKFPGNVQIIRSWPRRFGMVAGIDEKVNGVILIGYHSSTYNKEGVRAHTFSSARLTNVSVNGTPVSEGMWAAMVAGHFDVPVIMATGDNIAVEEIEDFVGDIETVTVKEALGFHSAKTLTPASANELIAKASYNAVKNIKEYNPYKLENPVELVVSFKHYQPSAILDYLSIVERVDSHSIKFIGDTMVEVADFFVFLMEYNSSIEP